MPAMAGPRITDYTRNRMRQSRTPEVVDLIDDTILSAWITRVDA